MLAVTDEQGRLKGVFTDGDLRRLFQQRDRFDGLTVDEIMHPSPKTIPAERLRHRSPESHAGNHVERALVTDADRRADRRAEYARFTDGADCVVQAGRLKPDSRFSDDLSGIIQAFSPIANPP